MESSNIPVATKQSPSATATANDAALQTASPDVAQSKSNESNLDPANSNLNSTPNSTPNSSSNPAPNQPQPCTDSQSKTITPPLGEPIVQLKQVCKAFGSMRVLDKMTLDIHRGQVTVIIGPSGTGKSVLLKHIVGLLKPDQGEVYFQNQRVDELNERQMVEIRKKIGFCFQMGALFDSLSVQDNIAFPLTEHTQLNAQERADRVQQALKMVLLDGIQHKLPAQLSGGQRKRVALARSIILNPELVLYDEPTTGLDPIRSDVIDELILSLNRRLGISSIVVTHDIKSATKIADRMILLYEGMIVLDGTPHDFCRSKHPLVRQFMQGQASDEELITIREGFRDGPHLSD